MRMFYREYREDWTSFLTVRSLDPFPHLTHHTPPCLCTMLCTH